MGKTPYLITLLIIGSFRLVVTLLSLLVLWRSPLWKRVFYQLLFALSCSDLAFIGSYMVSIGCDLFGIRAPSIMKYVVSLLNYYGLTGSIYMTVAISVERYLGVCHPLKTLRKKTRTYLFTVLLWVTLVGLPLFSQDSISAMGEEEPRSWAKTNAYEKYDLVLHIILIQFLIPMALVLFFNLAVIRHVYVSSKVLGSVLFPARRDTKSTKILIWIVILSVCHQTPRIVHQLLHHMPFINHDVIVPIYEIALMVMYLVSFLIYSVIGDTLRGEVMKMLKCQKRKNSEVETVSLENWMVGSSLKSKLSS